MTDSDKIMVTAMICPHCGHVDDLVPHPGTGQSQRCPCPHDEVTAKARARDVADRHAVAVLRARSCARPREAS